ncbi:hypothetical protein LTR53_019255, partial [Teratosphaeriaceae sp. CCFEE 6253]
MVERAALLKYQHLLLTALLNNLSHGPLLDNLPFSRDKKESEYIVSLTDLRERRIATLSSILSNMRNHLDTMHAKSREYPQVRRRYADMLRSLMQAMKSNYQDLQSGAQGQSADPHLQGAYVIFVQQIVSFLQQYTTDICA